MFVVLEGIDGCGKTTQADYVNKWLADMFGSDAVLITHEPGGWDGGSGVREFILNNDFVNPWSEFFLFMMDRCEHVTRLVMPALEAGKIVLSDRYTPSTLAYQILSNKSIPYSAAEYILQLSPKIGLPVPDVIFLLDISVDMAKERLFARSKRDNFDGRDSVFFETVRAAYNSLMESAEGESVKSPWIKIDASRSAGDVFADIRQHLDDMLSNRTI